MNQCHHPVPSVSSVIRLVPLILLGLVPVTLAAPLTWSGATSADWQTASNWSSGSVPTASDDVTIPAGTPNTPILTAAGVCLSLTVQPGASLSTGAFTLTVSGAVVNDGGITVDGTLNVAGGWTNNGTVSGAGIVGFNGSGAQELTGTGPIIPNLRFSGGGAGKTAMTDLDFNGNVTINSGNTFNDGGHTLSVAGTWSRSGTFVTTGILRLDGADQTFTFGTFASLAIAGTGSKTPTSGTLTITGALMVHAGATLANGASSVNVAGTVTNDGIISGTGTLTLNGGGQTITGSGTFNGPVALGGTGTKTAGSPLDFNGNVTINSGSTFDDGGFAHTVAGNWTRTGTYAASGTITFDRNDGTGQTINASNFNGLAFGGSGTKTISGSLTPVTLTASTVSSMTIVLTGTNTITGTGAGTFTVGADVTFAVGLPTSTSATGFPSNFASYALAATSTVAYQANAVQTIRATDAVTGAAIVYGNLNLGTGGTSRNKSPAGDLSIAGVLTIGSTGTGTTTLNGGTASYTVGGDWTVTATGAFSITGGTATFNGTAQTIAGGTFSAVVVSGTGTKRMGGNLTIARDLTISSGTLDANGYDLTAGTNDGGNAVSITGGLILSAGKSLRMASGAALTVNNGGTLMAMGTDAGNRVTLTNQGMGTYTIMIAGGGTIDAAYALVEFTGGNGLDIQPGATINAMHPLDHLVFQNGSGAAYLTVNNDQTLAVTDVSFGAGPSVSVSKTAQNEGMLRFTQYTGMMGGPAFEQDPFNQIGWSTTATQTVTAGNRYTFSGVNSPGGNDITFDVTAGAGDLTVSVVYGLHPDAPSAIGRYYVITVPDGFVADVTFSYQPSELGSLHEEALVLWRVADGELVGPIPPDERNTTGHFVKKNAVSAFSDWILAEGPQDVTLAVELSRFTAASDYGRIRLMWRTESEINNFEWRVERSLRPEGGYTRIATVPGQGSKPTATEYAYVDTTVVPETTYYYRLTDVESTGILRTHGPVSAAAKRRLPARYHLSQNHPNPFNPVTTIGYDLPRPGHVVLTVYNLLGQPIRTLVDRVQPASSYQVRWDGRDALGRAVPSGLYLYRLTVGEYTVTRKMVLVR